MQAWYLRKCLSIYNDICRRAHLPREMPIRNLMANTGIDLSLYGPASSDDLEPECPPVAPLEDEGDELFEECSEEEDPEADPCS